MIKDENGKILLAGDKVEINGFRYDIKSIEDSPYEYCTKRIVITEVNSETKSTIDIYSIREDEDTLIDWRKVEG